jgi:hypothetical protein
MNRPTRPNAITPPITPSRMTGIGTSRPWPISMGFRMASLTPETSDQMVKMIAGVVSMADQAQAMAGRVTISTGNWNSADEEADADEQRLDEGDTNDAVRNRFHRRGDDIHQVLALLVAAREASEDGGKKGAQSGCIGKANGRQDDRQDERKDGHQYAPGLCQQPAGDFLHLRAILLDKRREIIGRFGPGRVKLWADAGEAFEGGGRRPDMSRSILDRRYQRRNSARSVHRRDNRRDEDYSDDHAAEQHGGATRLPALCQQLVLQRVEADCEDDRPQEQADKRQQKLDAERYQQACQEEWK